MRNDGVNNDDDEKMGEDDEKRTFVIIINGFIPMSLKQFVLSPWSASPFLCLSILTVSPQSVVVVIYIP